MDQHTGSNQQSASKDKGFTPSSPDYTSRHGENNKHDDRQGEGNRGEFKSQRGATGDNQEQSGGRTSDEQRYGSVPRSNIPDQDHGKEKGQEKSGNERNSSGDLR